MCTGLGYTIRNIIGPIKWCKCSFEHSRAASGSCSKSTCIWPSCKKASLLSFGFVGIGTLDMSTFGTQVADFEKVWHFA